MIPLHMQHGRAQIAALFSDLFFSDPDHLQLTTLDHLLKQYFDNSSSDHFARGQRDLSKWQKNVAEKSKDELDLQIRQDFTQLFCLGKGSLGTTASVILSPMRLQKREPWQKVRQFYRENGWMLPESPSALEDSVAIEMAFYSLLQDQETVGEKDVTNHQLQCDFLNNHLLTWLPIFCDELYQIAGESSMYKTIASYLSAYIQAEQELLNDLPQPLTILSRIGD